ncbi:Eukaryotic porin/Tom40 [Cinara cedri]|uniref:Eukaryotic porin/Tom40 n=1 Tax=Cinara cedri TaxID=506608 RepID=A0A5E4MM17_9HEMI|nr:Eukaryotic porin/Tom40 [Cinara cedri]
MDTRRMVNTFRNAPTYSKSVFLNTNPSIVSGVSGCTMFESVSWQGNNVFHNFLTYRLTQSSVKQFENRFGYGFAYSKMKKSISENGNIYMMPYPKLCTYVESNLKKDVSYSLSYNVLGNFWAHVTGQASGNRSNNNLSASIEWANKNVSVQMSANKVTNQNNQVNISFTKRLFSPWLFGGQCTLAAENGILSSSLIKSYEGMFGYQDDKLSYAVTVDQSLSTALRAVVHFKSNTTSVELKHEPSKNELKCMLAQQVVLSKNLSMKGQVNSDGQFSGNIILRLMKCCTFSLSAMYNHYMDRSQVGLEVSTK